MKDKILNSLPQGHEKAVSANELCHQLNIEERQLRLLILQLRKEGYPILSDDQGYFLPGQDGSKECMRFIQRQISRAKSSFQSISGAKKYIDQKDQIGLHDLLDDVINV